MQNVVYPGRNPVALPKDDELILEYRLMVHNGDTGNIDMDEIYQNYSF